jgi:hypothetical protein
MTEYDIGARAYLARAVAELARGEQARMFYAAFELRAGIEARLQEYLKHWDHVPSGRKRDWRIAQLGETVKKWLQVERVARVQLLQRRSREPIATFYFTPVSPELRTLGERLGDYLHAQRERQLSSDPWWHSFRTTLEVGCNLLSEATLGTLLGPPLINQSTNESHLRIESPPGEPRLAVPTAGDEFLMDIRYFDSLADARGDAA